MFIVKLTFSIYDIIIIARMKICFKLRESGEVMLKIFLTGDNHIGLTYDRYSEIKDELKQSRLDSLERMVTYANENSCEFFVVAGDLFHRFSGIPKGVIKTVADILGAFEGEVLVLPGNHDYYSGDAALWENFMDCIKDKLHVHLLNEFKKYEFETSDGKTAAVYPAMCQSKHSATNNLGWIREEKVDSQTYNIGIAHGAIQGITPDMKNEYFLMEERELKEIPMDVWLIGHTHVTWPEDISCDEFAEGYCIFNAGTHEQTDLSCRTEGNGFLIAFDEDKKVRAKRYVSGRIRYYDLEVEVKGDLLREELSKSLEGIERADSVVRITLKGSISAGEYEGRGDVYRELEEEFLNVEIRDSELCERITEKKIKDEFAEISFPAKFLLELTGDGMELQMAYDLIKAIRNGVK